MAFEILKHWLGIGERSSTLRETAGKYLEFAQKIVPGKELARGLGYTLALPGINRLQQQSFLRDIELQNELLELYKKAETEEEKKRLKKALLGFGFTDIYSEVLKDAPTNRQVLASSGELALTAIMGYKGTPPKLGTPSALTRVLTRVGLPVGGKLQLALGRVILPTARGALESAGMFGLAKAEEKEATTEDIIRATETGGIVGGTVTLAAIGIGELFNFTGRKLKGPIGRAWNRSIERLEKMAQPEITPEGGQTEKTLSYIDETWKQKTAKAALKIIEFGKRMEMRLIDRFAPAKRVEQKIMEITGRPLKEAEKIYRDMRLLVPVSDAKAEYLITQYLDDLKPYMDVSDEATAWMAQLDFIDRARLGQTVPGNQSLDDLLKGLKEMAKEIGPQRMRSVATFKNITHTFNDNLLQMRVENGLITQELADLLRKTHPSYIPHNVILAIDERAANMLSQSLNVANTDIMKAVGSAKNIENPITASIQRTQIATRIMEKNQLLNNLVNAQEEFDVIPGMKKLIPEKTKILVDIKGKLVERTVQKLPSIPDNFSTINLFRNGIKETWMAPNDLVIAIKNLDTPITPGWMRILTTPNRILKKFATQYNLSFALPNKFRDKQTAYLTTGSFLDDLVGKYGLAENPIDITKLTDKDIKTLYKLSGGYGSSIFVEGESKILKDWERTGLSKILSSTNPAKLINDINETIETSTRLNVFTQGLQKGLSLRDAAFAAREATIDFAKMGTWMRPLNQAVPFLNARVQGFINLPRAFVKNPEIFARMQMWTAVYPTLLLQKHNRRYESYKDIPQYFKNRYWLIMINEINSFNTYNGEPVKVPQFITIPKGEGQILISGPLQWWLDKADKADYRKTSEMLIDTIGSASPMEFQTFDQGNRWLTLGAQFGPLISIPLGLATGKHPFFGGPIVPLGREKAHPEVQAWRTTPEVIKEVGKILNISPAKIEFVLNSFGGLSQDLQRAVDIAYGVVREGKIGGYTMTETLAGNLSEIPVARRFIRETSEYYGPEMTFRKGQLEEIEKDVLTENIKARDNAIEHWRTMTQMKTNQEKINYLSGLGDELTPQLIEELAQIKRIRQTVEVLRPQMPVEVRARYIIKRLEEMKNEGVNRDKIKRYLQDLIDAKIITSNVIEKIYEIQQIGI